MKKIIAILSVALLSLAACTQFIEDTPRTFGTCSDPIIELVEETTDTITVKVTAPAEAAYFTYTVIAKEGKVLDAATLLSLGYKDEAYKIKDTDEDGVEIDVPLAECIKVSPDVVSAEIKIGGVTEHTYYSVYAVAADADGILSEVVYKTILALDETLPVVKASSVDDSEFEENGTLSFAFNDKVELTNSFKDGGAKIYADYYGANKTVVIAGKKYIDVVFTEVVPVENVSVDGATVTIKDLTKIPGAIVDIRFDEAVFVNEVDAYNAKYAEGDIYGEFETAAWNFVPTSLTGDVWAADTVVFFNNAEELIMSFGPDSLITPDYNTKIFEAKGFDATIRAYAASGRIVTYPVGMYDYEGLGLYVGLSEEPDFGSTISVDIAEGSFEDIWGNPCAEFTNFVPEEGIAGNYLYSYGYTRDQFCGIYNLSGDADAAGPQSGEGIVIAPDPEDEFGVIIYDLFKSTTCLDDLQTYVSNPEQITKGKVNIHNGNITVEPFVIGLAADSRYGIPANTYTLAADVDSEDLSFILQMPQPGVIQSTGVIYMYLYGLGYWDVYLSLTLTKTGEYVAPVVPETPEATPASISLSSIKKKGIKR